MKLGTYEGWCGKQYSNFIYSNVADIFPFDILTAKAGPGTIVDIGGGKGHIMIAIAMRYPEASLRFMIQDLQANVEIGKSSLPAELQPKFEWIAHDFFGAIQPIQHAEAYFLRHILHDWPDKYCQKILKPIAKAMKPGYSRLLVSDVCLSIIRRL